MVNQRKHRSNRENQDEFHALPVDPQTATYRVEIFRRFRKWGCPSLIIPRYP